MSALGIALDSIDSIRRIPIGDLSPGPWQPRRVFDHEALTELAASIEAQGVLTPLRVVAASDEKGFLIVAGERRWRAAVIVGMADVPCLVLNRVTSDEGLHELAILDNLHRANLRPGEEVRAIRQLQQIGLSQRDISSRLGKSLTWVAQRIAISRLPDSALDRLDRGEITREEAVALSRLLDHPDLVDACLDPDGRNLRARLGGHVPELLGERVQAVRRALEIERQRSEWAVKMRRDGHRVMDTPPKEGDRRFIPLLHGTDAARTHQEGRLSCVVWAWDRGRPIRYCDDPARLRAAAANIHSADPLDRVRADEERRAREREEARDAVIRTWLATSRAVEPSDLTHLARERIRSLAADNDRLLGRLGEWLGEQGDMGVRVAAAKAELTTAGERRLVQLWFTLEIGQMLTAGATPEWLCPWLVKLGFIESEAPGGSN